MKTGLRRGKVALVPHCTEWEQTAQETIAKLKEILKDTAHDIQHVGSTAIKSICAKPIIDIAVGVSDLQKLLPLNPVLEENGFILRRQDIPGQYFYVCGDDLIRTHHIHAVVYRSEEWNNYLNMRDYLNCHDADAHAYEALKQSLATQYPDDRETYTAMKSDLIRRILAQACAWREEQTK